MKVLMISKALVVRAYHGKLRELSKLGVDLTVVVPTRWGRQKLEKIEPNGYELLETDCRFSGSHHFHYYPGVSRIIEREAWDLVHIDEEPLNLVTHDALKACCRIGRRAIFFTWQNIDKKYPPPFNYFERFAFQRVEAAIAGSEEVREILLAREFSKPIVVIPQFGIDPEFFRKLDVKIMRTNLGLEGKFVIGFVGRMVRGKGVEDLIRALSLLPVKCVLLMVGDGPCRVEAEQIAHAFGVADRVHWAKEVGSLKVPEYMNLMDVLVLPSRTLPVGKILPIGAVKEQFGRVLVEAMACEIPVVGSSSGEIPNVIGDRGLVFPEGDVTALVRQVRTLYENPEARAKLGVKGRDRVLERFTHRRIAEDTVEFYKQILADSTIREEVA